MKPLTLRILGALLAWSWLLGAEAAELRVSPGDPLQTLLDRAQPGDHLILAPGLYRGNFTIGVPLELSGEPGAVIDARHRGHALRIRAAGVSVHHLELRNWGDNLTDLDAGIFVETRAAGVRIAHNRLRGTAFGIWVDAAPDVEILDNRIQGNPAVRSPDRGNGIHLFNVSGALVKGNEVWQTRDGIYIDTSNHNRLIDNELHDLRYGIHYMYSYHNELRGNRTRHTRTGYALMQSKYLTVVGNRSYRDENYGMLMNYITYSTIENNWIEGVQTGRNPHLQQGAATIAGAAGKAIFIYNSLFNTLRGNRFSDSDLGIHLTAGSENNEISENAFIGNREQVKYVANRTQEWSVDGRGNYWGDYLGWDLEGDGIGDTPYEPNDAVDQLLWRYPAAKVLLNSPAIQTLRWVQRQFPVFKSVGVRDSHPLMAPPHRDNDTSVATTQSD